MEPFQFTEEATLYAKHATVVEEMQRRFAENMRAFFDRIAGRLQDVMDTRPVAAVVSGSGPWRSAYLWLPAGDERNVDHEPLVWYLLADPAIARDGELRLNVTWAKGSAEQRARVAELVNHPALAPHAHAAKQERWCLFGFRVRWSAEDDPVEAAVSAIEPLLGLLDETR